MPASKSTNCGVRRPCSRAGALLMAALLLMAASFSAVAETARRDGGDDALRKAQYLLRQLSAEQERLKTENAKLQTEIEDLKAENGRLETSLGEQESALARSRKNTESLIERVKSDGEKYRRLIDRYREKLRELRETQFKAAYLEQAVTERNQWIETCRTNNDELYAVNGELLKRYENRGFFDLLANAEPVTGLARVRTENVVEDYRYKLDDLKVLEFTESASAPGSETSGDESTR